MVTFHSPSRNGGMRWLWLSVAIAAALLATAAPAQAGPFAYVSNQGGPATVSQYTVGAGGLLVPLTPPTVPADNLGTPFAVAVSPNGRSVYVTNGNSSIGRVSQYDAGADGRLSPKSPPTVAAGDYPAGVAVNPRGGSVYVTNANGLSVSQYTVGAGGRLSAKNPATVAAGQDPISLAVSPDGGSVYVANHLDRTVSQYDVGAGGGLSPKSPATVAAGTLPRGVAVSPDGGSVYVTNNTFPGTVSQFNVGAGGKLFPKSPATVTAGNGASGVAVTPDGKNAYVTNSSPGSVSQYSVGAGGKLFPKSPAMVAAGDSPVAVAVSPDSRSVYVANEGLGMRVSQYSVGAGGKLFPKSPATVAAGNGPSGVAVTSGTPGWEGRVTNRASGCTARVQVPYLDGNLRVTAYTEVFCPRPTRLTIRSRLRSDYADADVTVAQRGCTGKSSCVIDEPQGYRYFQLICPKSATRQRNQGYYSDIVLYPGTNTGAATRERSRDTFLSPFCGH
jgi:DNA-binding beta-propeller fold protein YncE